MKDFFLQFFTWWHGQTLGTRFFTWRNGELVGEDASGNKYYRSADDKRWITYNGEIDASRVPAGWHGWLHHRTDVSPADEDYAVREWEMPHLANMTGTGGAYRPKGSLANPASRDKPVTDYEAWTP